MNSPQAHALNTLQKLEKEVREGEWEKAKDLVEELRAMDIIFDKEHQSRMTTIWKSLPEESSNDDRYLNGVRYYLALQPYFNGGTWSRPTRKQGPEDDEDSHPQALSSATSRTVLTAFDLTESYDAGDFTSVSFRADY